MPILFTVIYISGISFSSLDYVYAVSSALFSLSGQCLIVMALLAGKGGPIQAIDALKSLPTLFLNLAIGGVVPTTQQWVGVALGIAGTAVVGLSK